MEKNIMDCQRELYREITAYLQHINFARNCCVAYKSLYDNIQKNEQILNNAVGFFTITRFALSKCLLIELSKLFHGSSPQRTVRKLIGKVRANQNAFIVGDIGAICEECERKLEEFDSIITRLAMRRNKDLAHNDPIFFFGDRNPADENYISLDECEDLIAFVFAFGRRLLECLPAFDTIYLDSGADDFNEFIDVIKRSGCFNQ